MKLKESIIKELCLEEKYEGNDAQMYRSLASIHLHAYLHTLVKNGEPLEIGDPDSAPLFAFIKEVAQKGERGYKSFAHTKQAILTVIELCMENYGKNQKTIKENCAATYRQLLQDHPLLEFDDHFHLPGVAHERT